MIGPVDLDLVAPLDKAASDGAPLEVTVTVARRVPGLEGDGRSASVADSDADEPVMVLVRLD